MQTIENLLLSAKQTANLCLLYNQKEIVLIAIAMNDEAYTQLSKAPVPTEHLNNNVDIENELMAMLETIVRKSEKL